MSTSTITFTETRGLTLARLADYLELTKPKIAVLELVTVTVAAFIAGVPQFGVLTAALLGTALVAASASALNQWLERAIDARMPRTAQRPLPAGRLRAGEVLTFGVTTGIAGVLVLWLMVNGLTALLGLAAWASYVLVYTPMKSRTPLNTVVGAVAGALPVLIGWAAVGGTWNHLGPWTLFLIVFLWQFPHFMAIAWLYRRDYAAGGLKMLPVVDPSGRRAGVQAVWAALVLIPVSMLPAVVLFAGPIYLAWAVALGVAHLALAVLFCCRMNDLTARWLLRASLIYLPSLFVMLLLGPLS